MRFEIIGSLALGRGRKYPNQRYLLPLSFEVDQSVGDERQMMPETR